MKLADRWWMNAGLAGLVASLILVAFFEPGKKSEDEAAGRTHVVFAGVETATAFKVVSKDNGSVEFAKQGDAWRIVAPFKAPADPGILKTLLEGLAARSDARYPANEIDAAATGLASPELSLELGGVKYELGGTAPISYKRYVRGGDAVFLIDEMNAYRLNQPATYFVQRRLLPEDAKIVAIELPAAKLAQGEDGKWKLAPEDPRVSADAIGTLVGEWQDAIAMEAKLLGDEKPQGTVRLTLDGGAVHEFGVLAGDGTLRLARRDRGLVYELMSNMRRPLLELERVDPAETLTAGQRPAPPKPSGG